MAQGTREARTRTPVDLPAPALSGATRIPHLGRGRGAASPGPDAAPRHHGSRERGRFLAPWYGPLVRRHCGDSQPDVLSRPLGSIWRQDRCQVVRDTQVVAVTPSRSQVGTHYGLIWDLHEQLHVRVSGLTIIAEVQGSRFPGSPRHRGDSDLQPGEHCYIKALTQIRARVHAEGVIHQDGLARLDVGLGMSSICGEQQPGRQSHQRYVSHCRFPRTRITRKRAQRFR